MNQFRKKPVEVTAVQFNGRVEPTRELIGWIIMCGGKVRFTGPGDQHGAAFLALEAADGAVRVDIGDWIIRDDRGFHRCAPDVFDQTYEAVDSIEVPIAVGEWVINAEDVSAAQKLVERARRCVHPGLL